MSRDVKEVCTAVEREGWFLEIQFARSLVQSMDLLHRAQFDCEHVNCTSISFTLQSTQD